VGLRIYVAQISKQKQAVKKQTQKTEAKDYTKDQIKLSAQAKMVAQQVIDFRVLGKIPHFTVIAHNGGHKARFNSTNSRICEFETAL